MRSSYVIVLLLSLVAIFGMAQAQTFSISTQLVFSEMQSPNSTNCSPVYTSANGEVHWGRPAVGNATSGLRVNGSEPLTNVPINANFFLGQFQHFNQPIYEPICTQGVMSTVLTVEENQTFTFDFGLQIDETNNNVSNRADCPYPTTGRPCSDRIYWKNVFSPVQFSVDNRNYTLRIVGFTKTSDGNPINEFISEENNNNLAFLYAKIIEIVTVCDNGIACTVDEECATTNCGLGGCGCVYVPPVVTDTVASTSSSSSGGGGGGGDGDGDGTTAGIVVGSVIGGILLLIILALIIVGIVALLLFLKKKNGFADNVTVTREKGSQALNDNPVFDKTANATQLNAVYKDV